MTLISGLTAASANSHTGTNGSANCASTTWAAITPGFAAGATQVGFSLHQNKYATNVYINGSLFGTLPAGGGSRTGCFRLDVTGNSAPITSLLLDGHPGAAWVIDHLAVAAQAHGQPLKPRRRGIRPPAPVPGRRAPASPAARWRR